MASSTFVSGFIGQVHNIVNFDNGMCLLKFSVADNDSYLNKNKERVENTQWYNVEVRGKQGSFDNVLSKGVIAQGNYVSAKGRMRFKPVGEGQKGHYHSLDVANFGDIEVGHISDKVAGGQQQGGQQQGNFGGQGQQQGNFGGQGQQQGNFGGQAQQQNFGQQQGGQQQGNFGGQGQQQNFGHQQGGQQQGNFGGQGQQQNFGHQQGGQQQGNFGGQGQQGGGMEAFDDEIPF